MDIEQKTTGEDRQGKTWIPAGRSKTGIMILLAVLGIAAIAGLIWRDYAGKTVSTDNAKVAGDIVDISSKVSGRLEKILVNEGQYVEKGQIIAELDLVPLKLALDQYEAVLDQARANLEKLPDDLKSAEASVAKARESVAYYQGIAAGSEIALREAERTFKQNEALYQSGAIARDSLESSRSKLNSAQAKWESDLANVHIAEASLEDALAKASLVEKTSDSIYQAQLKKARADYDTARYNYENAIIKAPSSGTVVRIAVQAGENVSTGQTLLSVCDLENTYITANIEEKYIARIKPGQTVDISIDAYPGQKFTGKVESVSGAAQSVFSLIPAENTSGNYTKVTQRLPVKIVTDPAGVVLRPGMSAVVKVHTTG